MRIFHFDLRIIMNNFEIPTPRLKDSPHITLISPSGQRLQLYDKGSAWELVCRDDTLPLDPGITWLSFAKNGELSKLARFILERDTFTIQPKSEPYYIERSTSKNYWEIWKKDSKDGRMIIAMFHKNHPHSKEAAEAERDRLNEEYRKEQNNG